MKARTERWQLLVSAGYDPITYASMRVDSSHPCGRPHRRSSKGDRSPRGCLGTADGSVARDSVPAADESLVVASGALGPAGGGIVGRMGRWLQKVHRAISRCCPTRCDVCPRVPADNVSAHESCDGEGLSVSSQGCVPILPDAVANSIGPVGGVESDEETNEDPWREWGCHSDRSSSCTPRIAPLALFSKERCDLKLREAMNESADPAEESTSASDGEGCTFCSSCPHCSGAFKDY